MQDLQSCSQIIRGGRPASPRGIGIGVPAYESGLMSHLSETDRLLAELKFNREYLRVFLCERPGARLSLGEGTPI